MSPRAWTPASLEGPSAGLRAAKTPMKNPTPIPRASPVLPAQRNFRWKNSQERESRDVGGPSVGARRGFGGCSTAGDGLLSTTKRGTCTISLPCGTLPMKTKDTSSFFANSSALSSKRGLSKSMSRSSSDCGVILRPSDARSRTIDLLEYLLVRDPCETEPARVPGRLQVVDLLRRERVEVMP